MLAVRPAEVYRRVARNRNLNPEIVSSIGEAVFSQLVDCMQAPKSLAYELDHLGTFAVRHKNLRENYRRLEYRKEEKRLDFHERWKHIQPLIDDFQAKKLAHKQIKHEFRQKSREQS